MANSGSVRPVIVLGNVLLVPAGLPLAGAGTDEVAAFFGTASTAVGIASAPTPLAWAPAPVFGAGAVAALWRAERERGDAWSLVGFAGLLLQNAAFTGVIAIRLALAHNPDAAGGLWAFHDALLTLNGTFLALALIGLSVGGLRTGLIRRWHGGLGLLSAALLLTSATLTPLVIDHTGPLGRVGLAGWLLWVVWIVGYGVTLIRLAPGARSRARRVNHGESGR